MPFKHNAARRHHIPRARYRVTNWPSYEAGLRRRGDLTFWLDEAAIAGWHAPRRTTPGWQPVYSNLAIELVLNLRLVFHLAPRQGAGITASVLRRLGVELPVPAHTTLSRRGRAVARRRSRATSGGSSGPVHLVLDSTGLQLFGQGEWDAEKHGQARRRWMKLHLAVNVTTGEITAHMMTEGTADDTTQVPALLERTEGAIASVTADSAYDGEPTYVTAAARQPDPPPNVVVPPRASAVPSTDDMAKQSPRDRHIRLIAEHGRMGWQKAVGYGRRSLGETAVGRYKHLIGPKLRTRGLLDQQGKVALAVQALNRMIRAAKPISIRIS